MALLFGTGKYLRHMMVLMWAIPYNLHSRLGYVLYPQKQKSG